MQTCVESPNGRRCRRCSAGCCRVWGGCLALQRQRSSQALNTEARQRGGPAPKWCFIFSASTLSRLHPGSGSRLWGLPLIPLDPPLSPLILPRAPVCVSFLFFPSFSLLFALYYPCFCSCWCIQSELITPLFSQSCSFCLFLISDSNCSISCKYVINAKIILAFLTHFIFNDAVSDYLWKHAFSIIPLCRGKTALRQSCCCTSCENLTWHEANVRVIEAVHFMDLSERFSSTNVRDVHPVKTVGVCPCKQLQESVGHAVCVDTCSDAQMWPVCRCVRSTTFHFIFLSLWHFFLFPCAVKEAVIFHSNVSLYANIKFWFLGIFCMCPSLASSCKSSHCTISEKIWRFCYQASIPASL